MDFPIDAVIARLSAALAASPAAVLVAEPGAGKTTRVPLKLLDAAWLRGQKIVMLEPRRLAARTAARRKAETLGEETGETVGNAVGNMSVVNLTFLCHLPSGPKTQKCGHNANDPNSYLDHVVDKLLQFTSLPRRNLADPRL